MDDEQPRTLQTPFAIIRASGKPLTLQVEVEIDRASKRVLVAIVNPTRDLDPYEAEAIRDYFGRRP